MEANDKFKFISDKAIIEFESCYLGKMMSSPGLQYKKKNFAFYWNQQMCFKLGKNFDIERYEVKIWSHLNPFKSKPPLKAWYVLPISEMHHWEFFTKMAYEILVEELSS